MLAKTFYTLVLAGSLFAGGCFLDADDDNDDPAVCTTDCDKAKGSCEVDCDPNDNACRVECQGERDQCVTDCD